MFLKRQKAPYFRGMKIGYKFMNEIISKFTKFIIEVI